MFVVQARKTTKLYTCNSIDWGIFQISSGFTLCSMCNQVDFQRGTSIKAVKQYIIEKDKKVHACWACIFTYTCIFNSSYLNFDLFLG